jgi:hypothetical protein
MLGDSVESGQDQIAALVCSRIFHLLTNLRGCVVLLDQGLKGLKLFYLFNVFDHIDPFSLLSSFLGFFWGYVQVGSGCLCKQHRWEQQVEVLIHAYSLLQRRCSRLFLELEIDCS